MSVWLTGFDYIPFKILNNKCNQLQVISKNTVVILYTWLKNVLEGYDITRFLDVEDKSNVFLAAQTDEDILCVFLTDFMYILDGSGAVYYYSLDEELGAALSKCGQIEKFRHFITFCMIKCGIAAIIYHSRSIWLSVFTVLMKTATQIPWIEIEKCRYSDADEGGYVDKEHTLLYTILWCRKSKITKELWRRLFPTALISDSEMFIITYPSGYVSWIQVNHSKELKLLKKFSEPVVYSKFVCKVNGLYTYLVFVLRSGEVVIISNSDSTESTTKRNNKLFLISDMIKACCICSNDVIVSSDGIHTYFTRICYDSKSFTSVRKSPVNGIVTLRTVKHYDGIVVGITNLNLIYLLKTDLNDSSYKLHQQQLTISPHESIISKIICKTNQLQRIYEFIEREDRLLNILAIVSRCNQINEHIRINVKVFSDRNAVMFGARHVSPYTHSANIELTATNLYGIEFDGNIWSIEVTLSTSDDGDRIQLLPLPGKLVVNQPIYVNYVFHADKIVSIKSLTCRLIAAISEINYNLFVIPLKGCRLNATYFFSAGIPTQNTSENELMFFLNCLNKQKLGHPPVMKSVKSTDENNDDIAQAVEFVNIPEDVALDRITEAIFDNSRHRLNEWKWPVSGTEFTIVLCDKVINLKISQSDNRISIYCIDEVYAAYVKQSILYNFNRFDIKMKEMNEEQFLNIESIFQQLEISRLFLSDLQVYERFKLKISQLLANCSTKNDHEDGGTFQIQRKSTEPKEKNSDESGKGERENYTIGD